MKKYLLFLVCFSCFVPIEGQKPLSFPSEYIDFTIDDDYFIVNGIYTFTNNSGITINHEIRFPFAAAISQIDTISIIDLRNVQSIPFKEIKKEILFNVSIKGNDSTQVNILYRQKRALRNTYILTSAQSWGEPLRKAVYTLTASKNLNIKSFSIKPDSIKNDSIHKTYYWERINFLPQTDFEIYLDN